MKSGGSMPESKRNYFWDKLEEGGMPSQEQPEEEAVAEEAPNIFVEKKNNFVDWLKNESLIATEDQATADNIDMVKMGIDNGMVMKEGGEQWIQSATKSMKRRGTVGTFSKAAKDKGMSTKEFANKVMSNKENYSPAMVKKANFAKNVAQYGGDLPKAQFGEDVADMDWGDDKNTLVKDVKEEDITKKFGRMYKSPFMGKNKNQALYEQALREVREKYGQDANIENFQMGKTRFNPFRSKTSWTGQIMQPDVPTGPKNILGTESDSDYTGEPVPIQVAGQAKAWRALAPELKNKRHHQKERNQDFREKLKAEREYEKENAMSMGDAWRTKFTGEQKANIGLGAGNMLANFLGRDERNRADWQTQQNFVDNKNVATPETTSGNRGDFLGNVSHSSHNWRPDDSGQGSIGRYGNVAEFGGSVGDEMEMSEEELENFINLGGEVEYI